MKKLLALCLLAACELQPAPKQAPAPAGSAAPAAGSAAPVVVTPPPADAAVAVAVPVDAAVRVPPPPLPPGVQVTDDCQKAAVRYTDMMIASAPDAQRGIFEQDRANTVRRTEIACTQQAWPPTALACIDQSKNDREARACLEKFPPPGLKAPGTGSNGKPYHPPRD